MLTVRGNEDGDLAVGPPVRGELAIAGLCPRVPWNGFLSNKFLQALRCASDFVVLDKDPEGMEERQVGGSLACPSPPGCQPHESRDLVRPVS